MERGWAYLKKRNNNNIQTVEEKNDNNNNRHHHHNLSPPSHHYYYSCYVIFFLTLEALNRFTRLNCMCPQNSVDEPRSQSQHNISFSRQLPPSSRLTSIPPHHPLWRRKSHSLKRNWMSEGSAHAEPILPVCILSATGATPGVVDIFTPPNVFYGLLSLCLTFHPKYSLSRQRDR